MSIDRGVDKGVVHIYNGILLNCKKNEICPFAAMWMDIENIMPEIKSERKTNTV